MAQLGSAGSFTSFEICKQVAWASSAFGISACLPLRPSLLRMQEKALQLQTLKELEPVVSDSAGGQQHASELELCQVPDSASRIGIPYSFAECLSFNSRALALALHFVGLQLASSHAQEAVRRHLHSGAYQQQEIEEALGAPLQQLFADNPSSLRCKAAAAPSRLRTRVACNAQITVARIALLLTSPLDVTGV